ncbi:MAG: YqaE/Pmp3 family membrane protein [Bacteroidia bacterium]
MWAYILFAIILPPLAVGLYEGIHGPFWLSILLWFCLIIPGVIYAIWRVTK